MTKIVAISGSTRMGSSNQQLIQACMKLRPDVDWEIVQIGNLPLFQADLDNTSLPEEVVTWRQVVSEADAVLIVTPEYIHNLPAALKSALEWLTTGGELYDKRVLPITFTPHAPRGEKAMRSLVWSLQALDAQIVAELPLYQQEVSIGVNGGISESLPIQMLQEGLDLLLL